MTLSTKSIADGIASLTIADISIKSIDEIPEQIQPRDLPILYPHPDAFVNGGAGTGSEGMATFGGPSERFWIFQRSYKYIYLHDIVGASRGLRDLYPAMAQNCDSILEAITALDISGVDVMSIGLSAFGVLEDASKSKYFGFTLDLNMREKVNP